MKQLTSSDNQKTWLPLATPVPKGELLLEVESLRQSPQGGPLASQGGIEVFLSSATTIPSVMHEIGRLRELTFRAVGEGTGKSLDIDEYDEHYLHLFLWDPSQQCIAGAYRIGCTDRLLAEFGAEGLVTASCFAFEQSFLDFLNPGLELGRAFVSQAYQKSMYPLSLLWRGIGSFIARYPRYHKLFGCVSISDDYTRISQDLIVRYMRESHTHKTLSHWVHPHHAYDLLADEGLVSQKLESIEQVSACVANVEPDGKGVPVLLRQYLKLNATLLEFNVDPLFNNSLDALVLVDLLETQPKMLNRYLGESGAQTLLSHHGKHSG